MPRKILIVEDSPTMRRMYGLVLGGGGTELLYAQNGLEALDRAAQSPDIDLVIVDVNMPQMDGLEFLRRLRGELGYTRTPALVISTEGEELDRKAALAAGGNAYLTKPWTPPELLRVIRSLAPAPAE